MNITETEVLITAGAIVSLMVSFGSVWWYVDSHRVKVGPVPKQTPGIKPMRLRRLDRDEV